MVVKRKKKNSKKNGAQQIDMPKQQIDEVDAKQVKEKETSEPNSEPTKEPQQNDPPQNDQSDSRLQCKLKKAPEKKEEVDDDDDDVVFFKTLVPYLKGMSTVQKLLLRAEIQAVVLKSQNKKLQSSCDEGDEKLKRSSSNH
ncbi:uncharacterized protein LOC106671066 [Cimex lectularius]|uniref:BESS domain-containing protein n=1 Tax=Cimex lectularius TaxID=79782 RepID=A0A8I6S7H6_CIMLE|nr:uncharacterized protein LOC106671066 [Cimex lectularius]XP_014257350.1 uncharacterized protein LOC106671066 [Cimex lectularius]XP_014257351.1 uncharacterized protein LOC106671066 [Cimex lectularius]